MPDFAIDPSLSKKENIVAFIAHLKTVDLEMANLFEANAHLLNPFPDAAQGRTDVRTTFNELITTGLNLIASSPS